MKRTENLSSADDVEFAGMVPSEDMSDNEDLDGSIDGIEYRSINYSDASWIAEDIQMCCSEDEHGKNLFDKYKGVLRCHNVRFCKYHRQ